MDGNGRHHVKEKKIRKASTTCSFSCIETGKKENKKLTEGIVKCFRDRGKHRRSMDRYD
jgi:hypothetical protein